MSRIRTYPMKKNTVSYLYSIKDKIDISPPYQRHGDLWNQEKKQLFLDSIFNGYDIPKLYFHVLEKSRVLTNGKRALYAVIDGRQRLETLWNFIENQFPLGDYTINRLKTPINLNGQKYRDLARNYPSLKSFFDDFELPIMCVELSEEDEEDLIEDLFSRLNEAVSINAAEKRNAIGGKMVKIIRELAEHHPFFTQKVSFTNKRLQHHEVSARLLFIEHCIQKGEIVDTKKTYLDKFVQDYREKQPEPEIYQNVKTILNEMSKTFVPSDDQLKAQGRIPIYYLLFREAREQNELNKITREKIMGFAKKVADNKKQAAISMDLGKFDLLEYDRLTIQGTNDASSIKSRFHIISKYFGINSSEIDKL